MNAYEYADTCAVVGKTYKQYVLLCPYAGVSKPVSESEYQRICRQWQNLKGK